MELEKVVRFSPKSRSRLLLPSFSRLEQPKYLTQGAGLPWAGLAPEHIQ